MPASFPYEGILAALTIPTDGDGHPIRSALAAHLDWLRTQSIHGVLALGSTGEFARLDIKTRKAALKLIAELAAPLPVLANISDIRHQNVAELGRFARALNLPGVAVMAPSFYPVSDADQLAFFERAAEAFGGDMMLYNFPELTGNRISLDTIAAFADRAPLCGFKQSGAEFSYHPDLIALGREKGFSVFSGADTRLSESLALGAAGCIGGFVNFVPEYLLDVFHLSRQGADPQTPRARLCEVREWIDHLAFPLNILAGLEARGFEAGTPKAIVSTSSQNIYTEVVAGLRTCFARWNLPLAP